MHVRFLQAALAELQEAVAYYNGEREGLGFEFAAESSFSLSCTYIVIQLPGGNG